MVVNLILALLDDLRTAEKIPQLYRHLPAEFQTRRRAGDRRRWRFDFAEYLQRNHPDRIEGEFDVEDFRQWRRVARAARRAALEEE